MEKQANKLQNKITINLSSVALVLLALFFSFSANAQTKKDSITNNLSFEKGKEYILGGISVTGLKKFHL